MSSNLFFLQPKRPWDSQQTVSTPDPNPAALIMCGRTFKDCNSAGFHLPTPDRLLIDIFKTDNGQAINVKRQLHFSHKGDTLWTSLQAVSSQISAVTVDINRYSLHTEDDCVFLS